MTYEESVITGGSHALTPFYPHRPAGPPLRRVDPSGPPETPRSRPQVPRRATSDLVILCRRAPHLALRRLQGLARRPLRRGGPVGLDRDPARLCRVVAPAQRRLGRQLAPRLAAKPPTPGRRSGPDPLSWPAPGRPREHLPLAGQERPQPLPRLRHALRPPLGLPVRRGLDGRRGWRTPGGG